MSLIVLVQILYSTTGQYGQYISIKTKRKSLNSLHKKLDVFFKLVRNEIPEIPEGKIFNVDSEDLK